MKEVLTALVEVWGSERVGVRLSPNGEIVGCNDSDPVTLFAEAARVCEDLKLAFVELRQPGPDSTFVRTDVPKLDGMFRSIYKGALVLNSDYTAEEAEEDVGSGRCEAIAFGRPFICNPDLDERIRVGAAWATDTKAPGSWYSNSASGYIDYPTLAEEAALTDSSVPRAGPYKPVQYAESGRS